MHLRVNAESLHVGFGWYTSWGWTVAAAPVNGSLAVVDFVADNGCCDVDLEEDNAESFSWFWLLLLRLLWLFSFNESLESPPRRRTKPETNWFTYFALLIDCNKQFIVLRTLIVFLLNVVDLGLEGGSLNLYGRCLWAKRIHKLSLTIDGMVSLGAWKNL